MITDTMTKPVDKKKHQIDGNRVNTTMTFCGSIELNVEEVKFRAKIQPSIKTFLKGMRIGSK